MFANVWCNSTLVLTALHCMPVSIIVVGGAKLGERVEPKMRMALIWSKHCSHWDWAQFGENWSNFRQTRQRFHRHFPQWLCHRQQLILCTFWHLDFPFMIWKTLVKRRNLMQKSWKLRPVQGGMIIHLTLTEWDWHLLFQLGSAFTQLWPYFKKR